MSAEARPTGFSTRTGPSLSGNSLGSRHSETDLSDGLSPLLRRVSLCDLRDAGRRREDARVTVFPADADTRRIVLEDLFDHPCPARLARLFRLEDDSVSDMSLHLTSCIRLAPSTFGG